MRVCGTRIVLAGAAALSLAGCMQSQLSPSSDASWSARDRQQLANPPYARDWLQAAETVPGSWWPHYSAWLAECSGGEKDRPGRLGAKGFETLEPAPGLYVLDR